MIVEYREFADATGLLWGSYARNLSSALRRAIHYFFSRLFNGDRLGGTPMDEGASHRDDPANVIARVDGKSVADAIRAFPSAQHATIAVIHIPGKTVEGTDVLVTFERYSYKHCRNRFWAWRMTRAIVVPEGTAGVRES